MSNDSVPAIPPNTHLRFRPDPRKLRCCLCHRDVADDMVSMSCERCGAAFHGDCHLDRAASAPERAVFLAAVAEREAAGAPQLDPTVLARLATLAETLAVPLAEMLETIYAPGPAEQAVGHLVYLCQGCRS